jgi:2-dehydro-3-deoxygluconokinase
MAAKNIASIGECMLELSGADNGAWNLNYAGDTFNTLWAIRALTPSDTATDFVTAFGDDPFSAGQMTFFKDNGIGTAASPIILGARPGLYAITLTGSERSFTYWRNDAAARQLADDQDALDKSLQNRALVYFSGITLAILTPDARGRLLLALDRARRAGSKIAFDPNYRPRLWQSVQDARTAINDALSLVDIALPTFPDEQMLFGDSTPDGVAYRLSAAGVKEIVVKDGSDPALLVDGDNQERVSALTVKAVDTTGAGDSFNGGYLAARLAGLDPVEAAKRAHRVAAATVQVRGALAPPDVLRDAFSQA